LGGKTRAVRVEWEGLELNVTYAPGANTTAMQLALQQAAADDPVEGTRQAIDMLTKILVGWDFMKEPSSNGKEHPAETEPITEEFLHKLPASLVMAIIESINESQAPNRRKSGR
jgi:hypothetical protein